MGLVNLACALILSGKIEIKDPGMIEKRFQQMTFRHEQRRKDIERRYMPWMKIAPEFKVTK